MMLKKLKIQSIIITTLIIALILVWIALFIVIKNIDTKKVLPTLKVQPYTYANYEFEVVENTLSKTDVKQILDYIYKIDYTYKEQAYLGRDLDGIAFAQPNTVIIKADLDVYTYTRVLAHELTHLKYETSNETFTEYTALVTLYETNISMFQKVALNQARFIIGGGYEGTELDCGYYLLNYFGGKL